MPKLFINAEARRDHHRPHQTIMFGPTRPKSQCRVHFVGAAQRVPAIAQFVRQRPAS